MTLDEMKEAIGELHAASFAWALSCCGHNRALAEDVLHATYVKVLSGAAQFEERSSLKTWLFAVIRNTAREHQRKSSRRLRLLAGWFEQRSDEDEIAQATQPEQVEAEYVRDRVQQALEQLSERQREVLELVFYQEMTIEEASNALEMKLGTARTHYARGKKQMLKHLQADPSFEYEPA